MKVQVGISNRHIHLTKEDLQLLCGKQVLEKQKDLKQPGQFASTLLLKIKTEKSKIDQVRVLGPTRSYTQVEISKTDAYKLGLNPPIRESGELDGASKITIIGPCGEVTKDCAIIATRHIHIDHDTRAKLGLLQTQTVNIHVSGEKGGTLENVSIKETDPAYFELHLDTDDANAHLLKNQEEVEILQKD